ncbi:MAG: OsmC family protein [Chlorobiales bacterium]|jgi:putative redox protein|nr:OsmC family protein [Chlorobiales bacterium]
MKATIEFNGIMPFVGKNESGQITCFDTSTEHGGSGQYATPMEILLQAAGACSMFDVVSILKKKRKQPGQLKVFVDGVRAEEHPKVYTSVHLRYELYSPDASQEDLDRAVDLSMEKYCSVSATLKQGGCKVTWETTIVKTESAK